MDFRGEGEDDVDRISDLPQCILHHILSFLDLQQAIKTSRLSSKWRYVWRSLPFLNFQWKFADNPYSSSQPFPIHDFDDYDSYFFHRFDNSEILFDNVLHFHDPSSPIRKFHLNYFNKMYSTAIHESSFYHWICTVLRSSLLQDMYLRIFVSEYFELPASLFRCNSLQKLELFFPLYRNLSFPDSMSLPCLKTLVLSNFMFKRIDYDVLRIIFDSCPLLETLSFNECVFAQPRLQFCSVKLRHLVIKDSRFHEYIGKSNTIEICAPNLITFCCRDSMSREYSIENLSSLVKAEVDMREYHPSTGIELREGDMRIAPPLDDETKKVYAERMMKILIALHNVETLKLSTWFVEVIAGAPSLMEITPIKFCNLKHLNLGTCLSRDCVSAIMYLLNIAPIESIVVTIQDWFKRAVYPYLDEVNLDSEKLKGDWEASSSSQFMLYHLKFVRIEGVRGKLNELMFLKVLLKNGIVLEKMLVHTSQDTARLQVNFRKQLLALPRASSRIKIVLR